VPQNLLDRESVCARVGQPCAGRVPKIMEPEALNIGLATSGECDLKDKFPFWRHHHFAGKVILQNSRGYLMLQIAVHILAIMFFIA
jgi:hypothetical protein